MMITPSSIEEVHDVSRDGIGFTETLDTPVHYTSTEDSSFRTPEGVRIGMHLAEVRLVTKEPLDYQFAWGTYLRLPSGWRASCITEEEGSQRVMPDSLVDWLFRLD